MVGHAGIADGAEIDRIEGFELVEPVLRHHPPGARETLAAPVEGLHLEGEAMALRRRFEHAQARRYHLVADAIARDAGDLVGLAHGSASSAAPGCGPIAKQSGEAKPFCRLTRQLFTRPPARA